MPSVACCTQDLGTGTKSCLETNVPAAKASPSFLRQRSHLLRYSLGWENMPTVLVLYAQHFSHVKHSREGGGGHDNHEGIILANQAKHCLIFQIKIYITQLNMNFRQTIFLL